MTEKTLNSNKMVWGPWQTAGFGLLICVVLVLMAFVILFPIMSSLRNSTNVEGLFFDIFTIVASVICIFLTVLIIKRRNGIPVTQYLALRKINLKTISILVAITIAFYFLEIVIRLIFKFNINNRVFIQDYKTTLPVLFFFSTSIFGPGFEEVLFRGFLFQGFSKSRFGIIGAVLLITLVWSLLHIGSGIYSTAMIFLFGIIMGVARVKTNSLWSPLIMHIINNSIATFILFTQIHL